jgi:hypothetical protein
MGNTYNVNSYGQNGGITAGHVTIGKPPRQIDEGLKQQIRAMFPKNKPVVVVAQMGDAETYQFGVQIRQFLLAEGYEAPAPSNGLALEMTAPPLVGLREGDPVEGKNVLRVGFQDP